MFEHTNPLQIKFYMFCKLIIRRENRRKDYIIREFYNLHKSIFDFVNRYHIFSDEHHKLYHIKLVNLINVILSYLISKVLSHSRLPLTRMDATTKMIIFLKMTNTNNTCRYLTNCPSHVSSRQFLSI